MAALIARSHLIATALALAAPAYAQTQYRITDLTERAAPLGVLQSEARKINEAGRVVGFEMLTDDSFTCRAIVWEADGTASIPSLLDGDNSSLAYNINESGQALGVSDHVTVEYQGDKIFIFQDEKPALWTGGTPTNLRDLVTGGDPLTLKSAWDMNGQGWIVGHATVVGGSTFRGFLLKVGDGTVTDLGALDRPIAINESGQIVGYAGAGQYKAYRWDGGILTNLHDDPEIQGVTSTPGTSTTADGSSARPSSTSPTPKWRPSGATARRSTSSARSTAGPSRWPWESTTAGRSSATSWIWTT
jgi:probable HAF family extracellular repeat protein